MPINSMNVENRITNIKLLKSPLTLNNKNQITFKNKNEQHKYFDNLESIEIENSSYQRKNNVIRYPRYN